MYHVQYCINGKFEIVGTFNNIDKALSFIKYNSICHDIDINLVRIAHRGMVITINENSLKKVYK